MSKQFSPFAALTGAEKQIRWLEYQSVKLPYIQADLEEEKIPVEEVAAAAKETYKTMQTAMQKASKLPQPPPEVPRSMPRISMQSRHSQYDAVIARLKQAELQSRRSPSQSS